jgi:CPA2 family monovalent cation:H+ antiporter-2
VEQPSFVLNLTILLAAALVGGMVAHRFKQPVVLGYLIIGAVIGPYALGLVSDLVLIQGTAAIGVTLLMLTLGLEVSFSQFKQVGRVGLWGGVAQILVTILLTFVIGLLIFHWPWNEAVLVGMIISLSSTMVGLKVLMERGEMDSVHGRIMMAILILQDISVVLMIIVEPFLSSGNISSILLTGAITIISIVLFIGVAIIVGIWILPWLMGRVGGVRSRELFLLTILVICLGSALGTQAVGLSTVFGAFLIGLVLRETKFVHQALAEITPLRDIFAASFFVSLGMLLNLQFVYSNWRLVILGVGLVIIIKIVSVYGVVRFFGYHGRTALLAGVGMFQIGEFGFILAQDGLNRSIISQQSYDLIVASAVITMLLTPLFVSITSRLYTRTSTSYIEFGKEKALSQFDKEKGPVVSDVVIAGYGKIGQSVAQFLTIAGIPYNVIEIDPEVVFKVRCDGISCIYGDASNNYVLSQLNLSQSKVLIVTFPDPVAVLTTCRAALAINPELKVIARVQRAADQEALEKIGIKELINPEYEASLEFLRRLLITTGKNKADINRIMTEATKEKDVASLTQE